MSVQQADKIIIPVEVATEDKELLDEYFDKLDALQSGEFVDIALEEAMADAIKDSIEEAVEEVGEESAGAIEAIGGDSKDGFKGISSSDIAIMKDFLGGNPSQALLARFLPLLANPYVMTALVAAGLIPMIIDELYRAGGLLDPRFKRLVGDIAREEYQILSSLEHKAAIRLGSRQLIVTAAPGLRMGQNQINNSYDRSAFSKVGIMGEAGMKYDTFLKSKGIRVNP